MKVVEENTLESIKVKNSKAYNKDLATLNTPMRNTFIIPLKVPSNVPYT